LYASGKLFDNRQNILPGTFIFTAFRFIENITKDFYEKSAEYPAFQSGDECAKKDFSLYNRHHYLMPVTLPAY